LYTGKTIFRETGDAGAPQGRTGHEKKPERDLSGFASLVMVGVFKKAKTYP